VNKMDRSGADFEHAVDTMHQRLAARTVSIQHPIGKEDVFIGVIDFLEEKAIIWLEETQGAKFEVFDVAKLWDAAFLASRPDVVAALKASPIDQAFYQEHRNKAIERIAEHDDVLMDKYLNEQEITPAELRVSLRRSTIALNLVPVLAGSAFKHKGIQPLLDAVVDFLPSPLDVPPVEGTTSDDKVELRHASDDEPFAALAFKIMSDPFVGVVTFIRVYSGVLSAGSYVFNSTKDKRERIGRLLRMHANKREEIDAIHAGDIAAVVGLKFTTTGDTLCDEEKPSYWKILIPRACNFRGDRAKNQGGSGKAGSGHAKAGAGRSYVPRALGSRYRPDVDLRHGRVASGNHCGPHDA